MSKILEASCEGGVVTVNGLTVPGVTILSEGIGASQGVLLIERDVAYYAAKTSPDLEQNIQDVVDAIDELSSVLNTIAQTLTAIGAGMTGPTTAPPPTLPTNVASIITSATNLTAIGTSLNTLLGELR